MLSGITLEQLATHTAGLPREIAPSPRNAPHFTFPDAAQRWSWLATAPMTGSPGERALYSNVGFDLLSDALAQAAGRPYPELLHAELLAPLGMWDTTLYPSPGQCARLMRGARDEGACTATDATAGSSGLYSTAHDVAKYLGYLLAEGEGGAQAPVLTPAQLGHAVGLDHAGQPTAMGLAWVQILPLRSPDHIVEKTGGGAGYSTYIAIDHARGTAVFVALTGGGERHAGREPLNPFEAANRLLLAVCGLPPLPAKDETPVLAPNGAVVGGRPRAHHRPERHTHAPHTRRAMVP